MCQNAILFLLRGEGYVTGLIQKDGESVFPIEIQIGCQETREEVIILYIKPEDIVNTGYNP